MEDKVIINLPGYRQLGNNDCLRGCIANILNIPAKNLPDIHQYINWDKDIKTRDKIEEKLNPIYLKYGFKIRYTTIAKGLQIGVSENKKEAHALVCYDGKVIWCPTRGKVKWPRQHIKYYLDVIKL